MIQRVTALSGDPAHTSSGQLSTNWRTTLSKRRRGYDVSGMKLFGRCRRYGNCACGNCPNAPVNRKHEVLFTPPVGEPHVELMPAVNPTEYKKGTAGRAAGWGSGIVKPRVPRNYTRCPDCNKVLNSRHKCKVAAGTKLPGGEPITNRAVPQRDPRIAVRLPTPIPVGDLMPNIGLNASIPVRQYSGHDGPCGTLFLKEGPSCPE